MRLLLHIGLPGALVLSSVATGREHWSLQPVVRPDIPVHGIEDPIFFLVGQRLEQAGLVSAPTARRRDWIRRLFYNLTGLPPTYERLKSLVAFPGSDAALAAGLVEDLLSSPHYGERWARHWLDVARYSDTKGYAYAGEEFDFPHAWVYRDWVVESFNRDLPYNKFIQRQIAADLLLEEGLCDRSDLAAMGFLTLGRRFLGVEPDIIDDRIDVVTRGVLGLTVSCSRCHDHKFDAIPTADYYALYGVFKSSREELRALEPAVAGQHAELRKKTETLAAEFEKRAVVMEKRYLERSAEYMLAALDISKVPPPDFAEIIEGDDLIPAQIRRWHEFLSQEVRGEDPVFGPWVSLGRGESPDLSWANPLVAEALSVEVHGKSPVAMQEVAGRYAELLQRSVDREKDNEVEAWRELRAAVEGPGSPIHIPRDYIHDVEWLFDDANKGPLKKAQAALDREVINLREKALHALCLVDRPVASNVRIFGRGRYPNQLAEVARGSLAILHGGKRPAYEAGSGRLELARELTAADNPFTARVIVNRLWRGHFGEGLVRTDSDFGVRSGRPSHPELLDFLAAELMEHNWSLKHVQRLIATSALARVQAGNPPSVDAGNRLLSVHPRRRLDFESMRDSMLAASGELDLRVGGPPGELLGSEASRRRSLYGRVDRQYLPATLSVFDFANPELHSPRRYRTNVPQQALFLLNAPFTVARAQALAERVRSTTDGEQPDGTRVERLFMHVYGRRPTMAEAEGALAFLSPGLERERPELPPEVTAWSYGYGRFDHRSGRVRKFHELPHFSGRAWGGGEKWPDPALGWVRLTAAGGHVGNKVEHAAIRRWTSPVSAILRMESAISKIEDCGDGLRAWVSSSRQGLLGTWEINFGKTEWAGLERIEVEAGDTLDFIVDCGAENNFQCDGFEWAPRLETVGGTKAWDAKEHFGGERSGDQVLDPWERLAQALLISNEAMFLD